MKKTIAILICICLLASALCACTAQNTKRELIVFAAASMLESMTQIKAQFEHENPEVCIVYNFDSSGTLKTQIEQGAPCDLFISAAPKQMNALQELGLIDSVTRIDLLENKVVLCTAEGNPAQIASFDDFAARVKDGNLLFAMGNSDVPVGQYTSSILTYYGLDEATLAQSGCITYGSNVKEVTTQLSESLVACGIIYATDAYSAGLSIIDTATLDMCGRVLYPAAVIHNAPNNEDALAFLDYLQSLQASDVFESVGFTALHD